MNRLGIITALPAEARLLSRHFDLPPAAPRTVQTLSAQISLTVSGVGPAAARQAASALLEQGVDGLMSWGCAAGLSASCQPGDLFLPNSIVAGEQRFVVDNHWQQQLARRLNAAGIPYRHDNLTDTTDMLTGAPAKVSLAERSGALLADMESAAIARLATEHHKPFLCVRAVADNLDIQLSPALLPLLDAYGRPHKLRLLQTLLVRPQLIPGLIRLGRAFAAASRTLTRVINCDPGLGMQGFD